MMENTMEHATDMGGMEHGMDMGMEHGMDGMMMMGTGPLIWGIHLDIFLMLAAGIFYLICSFFVLKSYLKDKNELVGALLAFLIYQAINMFFMGLDFQLMTPLYGQIAALSVFVGSAYMLKFPFSSYSKGTRTTIFLISMIVALAIFGWFMYSEARQVSLMNFILWYDLVVNGIVVGGFMFLLALRTTEKWLKIKAFGGSTGVISCCVVSNGAMIGGSIITGAVFGFVAPVLILLSLLLSKKNTTV